MTVLYVVCCACAVALLLALQVEWRLRRARRVVLELLATGGEQRGLALVERSSGRLKRGTIYVVLDALETEGLILGRTAYPGAFTPRTYRITERGLQKLNLDGGVSL